MPPCETARGPICGFIPGLPPKEIDNDETPTVPHLYTKQLSHLLIHTTDLRW